MYVLADATAVNIRETKGHCFLEFLDNQLAHIHPEGTTLVQQRLINADNPSQVTDFVLSSTFNAPG